MIFTISNVISYDKGEGAIENGGKIVALAPSVVKYDNSKVNVAGLPVFVIKLNLTQEEFDAYSAQKMSGEELLVKKELAFDNPEDSFGWIHTGSEELKEFTLQKGFYVIGYYTSRTGNVLDLMGKTQAEMEALIIPKVGYLEVK